MEISWIPIYKYIYIALCNQMIIAYIIWNLNYLELLYHIYPTPPLGQDMTQGQFLSGV